MTTISLLCRKKRRTVITQSMHRMRNVKLLKGYTNTTAPLQTNCEVVIVRQPCFSEESLLASEVALIFSSTIHAQQLPACVQHFGAVPCP